MEPGNEESGLSESHFSRHKAFVSGSSVQLSCIPVAFIVDVACLGVSIPHLALICSLPTSAYILSLLEDLLVSFCPVFSVAGTARARWSKERPGPFTDISSRLLETRNKVTTIY